MEDTRVTLVWVHRNMGTKNIRGDRREHFPKDIYFFLTNWLELVCMPGLILQLLNVWISIKNYYVVGNHSLKPAMFKWMEVLKTSGKYFTIRSDLTVKVSIWNLPQVSNFFKAFPLNRKVK